MGEKRLNPVTIGDKNYIYEDLTQEQQNLFSHCVDLDRKINNTNFNLEQLIIGKEAVFAKLQASLSVEKTDVEVVE